MWGGPETLMGGFRLGTVEELCWCLSAHRGRVFLSLGKFIRFCWHFGGSWGGSREFSWSVRRPCLCLCWSFGHLQSLSYSPVHHPSHRSMCLLDDFAKWKNSRHHFWTLHFIFTKKERILSVRQSYYTLDFSLFKTTESGKTETCCWNVLFLLSRLFSTCWMIHELLFTLKNII